MPVQLWRVKINVERLLTLEILLNKPKPKAEEKFEMQLSFELSQLE